MQNTVAVLDTPQVFVEGEEEVGSPGMADLLRRHSALLAADFVISTDSGQISATQGGILLGLRGMAAFEVEARTLAADVHSGASLDIFCDNLAAISVRQRRHCNGLQCVTVFGVEARTLAADVHSGESHPLCTKCPERLLLRWLRHRRPSARVDARCCVQGRRWPVRTLAHTLPQQIISTHMSTWLYSKDHQLGQELCGSAKSLRSSHAG